MCFDAVSSTVLFLKGADSVGRQLRGDNYRVPLQWRNQFWHSLEEGAGKQCSERGVNLEVTVVG